jgi:hypothetical protein
MDLLFLDWFLIIKLIPALIPDLALCQRSDLTPDLTLYV